MKAKDLELQLEDAKFAQKHHLNKNENISSKMFTVQASNEEMKTQLALYAEKFVMFEDALTRSTNMFEQFEHKIANLDETHVKMNEEKNLRKEICCKLDLNMFDLIDEKSKPGQAVAEAEATKLRLQNECRMLQQTRSELKGRGKEDTVGA